MCSVCFDDYAATVPGWPSSMLAICLLVLIDHLSLMMMMIRMMMIK